MRSLLLFLILFFSFSVLADNTHQSQKACEIGLKQPIFHQSKSAEFWQHLSELYAESEKALMQKQSELFYQASRAKEEHAQWLQSVGYSFGLLQRTPSLKKLMRLIYKQIEKLDVPSEQKIWPMFSIVNPYTLESAYVSYGEELPEGNWVLKDEFADKIEFYEALTAGVFPLGPFKRVGSLQFAGQTQSDQFSFKPITHDSTNFHHDLAHVSAFILHPELMSAVYKHKHQIQTTLSFVTGQITLEKEYKSTPQFQRIERFGFIFEDLILVDPEKVSNLFKQIQFPDALSTKENLSYEEVYSWLADYQNEKFRQIHIALIDAIESDLTQAIGGAPRDIVLRNQNHPRPTERNFLKLLKTITNSSLRHTDYDLPKITAPRLFEATAQLLVHLVYLRQLDISIWSDEVWQEYDNGPLQNYLQNSGVFWQPPQPGGT